MGSSVSGWNKQCTAGHFLGSKVRISDHATTTSLKHITLRTLNGFSFRIDDIATFMQHNTAINASLYDSMIPTYIEFEHIRSAD